MNVSQYHKHSCLFVINLSKSLQITKKVVPLHPHFRNEAFLMIENAISHLKGR